MAYARSLQALADPTRRLIFERLKGGPLAVGQIAAGMAVSRPAVSQHLRVLKEAALVAEQRQGTRNIYRIDARGLKELRDYVEGFWREVLESFKEAAEKQARDAREGGKNGRAKRTRSPKEHGG
jgi:DNA-binding transcriptional ArsR family regulator